MTPPNCGLAAEPDRNRSLRATVSVGGWTLISRATGFVRLAAIGAVLGPSFLGNLFQAANQLPNLAFELVAGQLIASLLLPVLVAHLDAGDRATTERLVGGFLGVVLVTFAVVALVLTAAGPLVIGVLAVGVDDGAVRSDMIGLGWPLLAVLMPQLVLYGFIGVANAVQNARHRFGLAGAAPVAENVVVVAALLVFRARVGSGAGADLATTPTADVVLLGAGSTLGVGVHAALQWWGAHRVGVRLRPRRGWRDPQIRAVVRLALPGLGLAALNAGQTFACLVVVASVAGGVVALQLGLAFVATAVALGARPLTVATLPDLARLGSVGDLGAFRRHWDRALGLSVFLLAPIAVGLSALAPALGRLLGVGEMSSDTAVGLVAAAAVGLSIAVLGEGMTSFTTHAAYALRDTRAPFHAAIIRTLLLTAGLGMTLRLDRPAWVVLGTGLSYSLGTLLSAWYLCHTAAQQLPGERTIGRHVLRGVALATGAGVPALAVALGLSATLGGPAGRVAPAAVGGLVLGLGYLAAQQVMVRRFGWPALALRADRSVGTAPPGGVPGRAAIGAAGEGGVGESGIPGAGGIPAPSRPRSGPRWTTRPEAATAGAAGRTRRHPAGATTSTAGCPDALGPRLLRWSARPAGLLVVAISVLGPAVVLRDARWLVLAAVTGTVLLATARPPAAALGLALLGPLGSAVDVRLDTWVTLAGALSVLAGVGLSAAASRARGARPRRIRLGVTGWSSVLAAGLVGIGAGLAGGAEEAGLRAGVVVAAVALVLVAALDPLRDLYTAARWATASSVLAFPAYLMVVLVQDRTMATDELVGLAAATAAGAIALGTIAHCRRHGASPGPAVLCAAAALAGGGGWCAVPPLAMSVWLVHRHRAASAAGAAPPPGARPRQAVGACD